MTVVLLDKMPTFHVVYAYIQHDIHVKSRSELIVCESDGYTKERSPVFVSIVFLCLSKVL